MSGLNFIVIEANLMLSKNTRKVVSFRLPNAGETFFLKPNRKKMQNLLLKRTSQLLATIVRNCLLLFYCLSLPPISSVCTCRRLSFCPFSGVNWKNKNSKSRREGERQEWADALEEESLRQMCKCGSVKPFSVIATVSKKYHRGYIHITHLWAIFPTKWCIMI